MENVKCFPNFEINEQFYKEEKSEYELLRLHIHTIRKIIRRNQDKTSRNLWVVSKYSFAFYPCKSNILNAKVPLSEVLQCVTF